MMKNIFTFILLFFFYTTSFGQPKQMMVKMVDGKPQVIKLNNQPAIPFFNKQNSKTAKNNQAPYPLRTALPAANSNKNINGYVPAQTNGVFPQNSALLKDINPNTADYYSNSDPAIDNQAYPDSGIALPQGPFLFAARNFNGTELWQTNGTDAGTVISKDINSGGAYYGNSNPMFFQAYGKTMYFFTADYDNGSSTLYPNGTTNSRFHNFRLYKRDSTGYISGGSLTYIPFENVQNVIQVNGSLYFVAFGSDGYTNTTDSLLLRYDLNNDYYDVIENVVKPRELYAFNNRYLIFSANNGVNGREPWKYDSQNDDAELLFDVNTTNGNDISASSNPHDFIAYHNTLFYTADDGQGNGLQIKTALYDDGAEDFVSFSGVDFPHFNADPHNKTIYNDMLYCRIVDNDNGNFDVYSLSGTYPGFSPTHVATDNNPNNGRMAIANNYLFFSADNGSGNQLWHIDDNNNPGLAGGSNIKNGGDANPHDFTVVNNQLLFIADDNTGTQELWKSDGDNNYVVQGYGNYYTHPKILGTNGNFAYFFYDDNIHGQELWKTNADDSTLMVSDIDKGTDANIGSDVGAFANYKGALYFGAYDGNHQNIYKTDGTAGGTSVAVDMSSFNIAYPNYYQISQLKVVGNTLFFNETDSAHGTELWKTDGTLAGTSLVKDINSHNTDGSNPQNFTVLNGKLYFTANDGTNNNQLWVSDGTSAGTVMVKDINGTNDPNIGNLVADTTHNKLYFTANNTTNGNELWVSDGTNTTLVKDINTTGDANPSGLIMFNGKLFFGATDPAHGTEIWTSDGTSANTVLLKDITPGSSSSLGFFPQFSQLGSYLYFGADSTGDTNTSLWRTDGTANGTHLLSTKARFIFNMASTGNKLGFIASGPLGFSIFTSDGTDAGTLDVSDFAPYGTGSYSIGAYTTFNNHYFTWNSDNFHGNEMWQTDGTVAGSFITDIAPGELSSYPTGPKGGINQSLVFSANDGSYKGNELWKVNAAAAVMWINFTATKSIDTTFALLHWATASETNNKGFYIERSRDDVDFDTIGYVPAASPSGANYSFTDSSTFLGANYYRLHQVDNAGNSLYSNVELLTFSKPLKGGIVKGNDTLCVGTQPTDIVDSVAASGGNISSCTLIYSGVDPKFCYSYQWQDSVANGTWVNVTAGTPNNPIYYFYNGALNVTTYFRRKVYDDNHLDSAYSNIVAKVYKTIPGDTSFAPTNRWNAYFFVPQIGAADVSLTDSTSIYHGYVAYLGYFPSTITASPDYDTQTDWNPALDPNTANNYQGCPLPTYPNDRNFTVVLKRSGFSSGNYLLNLTRYTSNVRVFVNHVQFFDAAVNYLGGSSPLVSLGALNPSSVVEIRMVNQTYNNYNQLSFTFSQSPLVVGTIGYDQTICASQTPNQLYSTQAAYGGPAPLNIAYQWQSSLKGTANFQNVLGATSANYQPPILTDTTYFRRMVGDGQSAVLYSDTIVANVLFVKDVPTITKVGRVLYANQVPGVYSYKWFKNGVVISGATNATYTAALAGSYTAKYTEACGDGPLSNAITFANDAQAQTINFPAPPNIVYGTSSFIKLTGMANSGLGVQYNINYGPATISNDTVYITGTGNVSINASQPGNDNYTPATSINQIFTITPGSQTITLTPITNKNYGDAPFTVSASSSAGLGINFSIVSGPAYVYGNMVTLTGAGTVTVKASQPGNGNYTAATDATSSFCVGITQISAVKGDTLVCPSVYKYVVDSITGGIYEWGVSGGGTVVMKGDTAIVTWQTAGDYIVFAKAYSGCNAIRSTNSTLVVHVATVVVPTPVTNMFPADGTQNLQLPLTLSWIPGANSNSYDLYVWNASATKPATPYASGITGVNFTLPNVGFAYNTTYKWSVTSHNPCAQIVGPTQSFSLIPLPDLMVSNIQVPATAFSGQNVAINWKVTNNGPGITNLNQRWTDAVFLSFDSLPNFSVPPQTNPAAWSQLDFPLKPLLLGAVSNVSALNNGESYNNSLSFTLPLNYNFPVYTYVITNYAPGSTAPQEVTLLNDTAHAPATIAVALSPAPDLRVDSVITPAEIFSGSTINVTYKVKNYGVLTPSSVNAWTDKVYISQNPFFDATTAIPLNAPKFNGSYFYNAPLAEFGHFTQLQQDSSYTNSVSVVIPNFIQGSYYIYVVTDAKNTVYEGSLENNNTGRNLVTVFLTPTPNLTITSLSAPTTASTTQQININWNIKNTGYYDNIQKNQGHYLQLLTHCSTCYQPACGLIYNSLCNCYVGYCPPPQSGYSVKDSVGFGSSYWNDNVYLSTDSTQLNTNTAVFVGSLPHGTPLDGTPYDTYTSVPVSSPYGGNIGIADYDNPRSHDVNVANSIYPNKVFPSGLGFPIPGNLPSGNYYAYVYVDADNGVYEYPAQRQIRRSDMIVIARPDVAVTSVSAPATSVSGQLITVSYQITNGGPGSVLSGHFRQDYVYASTSPVFDANAQLIGTPYYNENLPINVPVTHQVAYQIPISTSGKIYFYVKANVDSNFRENNYANNINTTPGSTNVTLAPTPNLLVSNITVPNSVSTVVGFPFSYTVPNNGPGTTTGTWTDSIFVSCSPTYDPSTAYGVGIRTHSDAIASGGIYTDSFSLSIPFTADISSCFGSNNPTSGYFYVKTNANHGLYEGSSTGDNVLGTGIRTITNPFVDQIVTSVIGMDTATVGRNYSTTWTVKNIGQNPGYNNYNSWNDALYFSTDSVFNSNAVQGGYLYENTPLNNNQTYTSTSASFITPNIAGGDYYVFINTNNYNNIHGEINLSNNNNLIRDANAKAKKIHVVLPPLPDLIDTILIAQATVATGQPLSLTYKVSNNGSGVTYPSTWSDGVWLSSDFIPGNAGDIFLGSFNHSGALQIGQSYTDSISLPVSMNVTPGNYVLIAKTNTGGGVFETNTNNNLAFRYVTVYTPPPTDLIVTNIIRPDTVYLGYPDSTTWSISNISANPANGIETDGVYLSKTTTLDSTAVLLGTIQNKLAMLPLTLDTIKLAPIVQGITEGQYYLIIKTDILNNIVETNKNNNAGVSATPIYVKVKPLPLNVITAGTLKALPLYYKLSIPDSLNGATILLTLKSNDSLTANNQLYVGLGYVPTAAKFDYAFGTPNYGNQQILMPSVSTGDYYITTNCTTVNPPTQNITLLAVNLPFAIVSVDAKQGGNSGNVTVKITGSLLTDSMKAVLHSSSANITASKVYYVNSTTVYATFNLQGATLGTYDMILTKTDASTTTLSQGFTVVNPNNGGLITGGGINTGPTNNGNSPGCDPGAPSGLNAQLQTQIVIPPKVFGGRAFTITINFSNPTNVDISAQSRILYSLDNIPISFTQDGLADGKTSLYIQFTEQNGPPGIIRAGGTGTITIYSKTPANYPGHTDIHYNLK